MTLQIMQLHGEVVETHYFKQGADSDGFRFRLDVIGLEDGSSFGGIIQDIMKPNEWHTWLPDPGESKSPEYVVDKAKEWIEENTKIAVPVNHLISGI